MMTVPPAVLVVNPDAEILDAERKAIRAHGMIPIVCLGPDRSTGCPLLEGSGCPLRDQADAMILELDLDVPDHIRVLRGYLQDDRPKIVVVSPQERPKWERMKSRASTFGGPGDVEDFLDDLAGRPAVVVAGTRDTCLGEGT